MHPSNPFFGRGSCFTNPSFRDSRAQDLRPEESTLRLLNHLLVHALRRVVHHHRASLVIQFRVNSSIPDQVDDPFLAIFFRQSKPFGEVPDEPGR